MGKLKQIWEKIKKWFLETAVPWLRKAWLQIVNVIIVFIAYGQLDNCGSGAAWLLGFWAFILAGYWIFWKFFGADKAVLGLIKQWKKKRGK